MTGRVGVAEADCDKREQAVQGGCFWGKLWLIDDGLA